MHNLKAIREALGVTQQSLAEGLDCTQGNIYHYERGQDLPSSSARKLIEFARQRGMVLSFDHVYGSEPLPGAGGVAERAEGAAPAAASNPTDAKAA